MVKSNNVWRVRAAEFRRMARTSEEAERERKLIALAEEAEERADAIERNERATA